jgi:hypothetical protein
MSLSRNSISFSIFSFFTILVAGCGSDSNTSTTSTANLSLQMKLVAAPTRGLGSSLKTDLLRDKDARTGAGASFKSFTPVSYKFPIVSIEAIGTNVNQKVYDCTAGVSADCLVDLADATAVKALLANKTKEVSMSSATGTITKLSLSQCGTSESSNISYVKGTMSIGGTTYYTTSNATTPLSTNSADYGYTAMSSPTCTTTWTLPAEVELTADKDFHVDLFVSLTDIAYAGLANPPSPGGCTNTTGQCICMNLTAPFPYVGEAEPTLEAYSVLDTSNDTYGRLLLLVDSTSTVLGGYARKLYDGDKLGSSNFESGGMKDVTLNADSTYTINMFGSTGTEVFAGYSAFQRATHSGTRKSSTGTAGSYAEQAYTATKLQ